MASSCMHPATSADLSVLWPAVRAAHVFGDKASFFAFYAEAPWRVRMSSAGAAAVVERWRDELDILAVRGLWCSEYAIPGFIDDLSALAAAQGFARLMSPLVPTEAARAYIRSGMEPLERLISLRADRPVAQTMNAPLPKGFRLRRSSADDAPVLDEIDRACFEPFWAYGADRIARYIAEERVVVAESADGPIGYTLCTVERASGTLGRLAVLPECRRKGIGAHLVADAVAAMLQDGAAAVTLCTQEENRAARDLYGGMGFRELPGGLVLLICEA